MPKRSSKQSTDVNQMAHAGLQSLIRKLDPGSIEQKPERKKNRAAVALGRLGGKKGGRARAEKLTDQERTEIARNAAKARWSSRSQE